MPVKFSQNLISNKDIVNFIDHYAKGDNWHNLDEEKGNLGYGWVHYAIIKNIRPARVLVIGSRYGFIPAVCAIACRDNGKGIVDFVDAGYDQDNPRDNKKLGAKRNVHWGGVGFWVKNDPKKHFAKFGLDGYINTYIMTSSNFKNKYPKRRWKYIYLDGDHSYKGVSTDFNRYWLRVKRGGFLSLHDIYTKRVGGLDYGVSKLWGQFKKSKKYNLLEMSGEYGLGIIQK